MNNLNALLKLSLFCLIVLSTSMLVFYVGIIEPPNVQLDNADYSANWLPEQMVYLDRQEHLFRMCKNYYNSADDGYDLDAISSKKDVLEHILVDSKHKLLYCYVPKVACTNWKRIMMVLLGIADTTNILSIPSDLVHHQHIMPSLINYTTPEIHHLLTTYTKFIFVRHPFERLLSAYRNKFEQRYNKYFQARFGRYIIKNFRSNPSNRSLLKGDDVTFQEFVTYLTSDNITFNEHWMPIYELCQPCLIKYDFIGKYETLLSDSDFLLKHIGVSDIKFPRVHKPVSTSNYLTKYMSQLSSISISHLYKVYYHDFKLFKYDLQGFLGYEVN